MAFVIADNSLLQVLTTVKRLDLLAKHKPIHISRRVRKEHGRRAPDPAETYLEQQIKAGFVKVESPGVSAAADALCAKYRRLSFEDAEGLAWTLAKDGFLLSDDRGLLEAAEAEGADAVDLSALLLACKHEGRLTRAQLRSLVAAIELDADHAIAEAVKAEQSLVRATWPSCSECD